MRRGVFALVVVFLLSQFAYPTSLLAEYELHDAIKTFGEKRYVEPRPARLTVGPLKIHPTLRTNIEFDSNVLLQDTKPTEDIVFDIFPGAIVELPINRHQLVVGYEADIEFFTKTRNHIQNDQNQNFFVLADLNFPRFYINVLDKFRETSSRSGTTFTSRIPRYDHSIHPKVGIRFGRAILEFAFRHFVRDYRRSIDDRRDFQTVDWTAIFYWELFARLKALVEYQYGQIDYDDNLRRRATINQARVGLVGDLMPNLTVNVKVGPHFRNYKVNEEPDFNSWIGTIDVDYDVRENLRLNAGLKRNAIEATFSDTNFFIRHLISFGIEYDFLSKWTAFTEIKYYKDNYQERVTRDGRFGLRRDDHVGAELGIRYEPREWMEFELAYNYARRDSNFRSLDYTDHRIALSSSFTY